MNIFELIPPDHFTEIGHKVRNSLKIGESVLVYGVYGSGIQYFTKYFEYELKKTNSNVLFFRGALISKNSIQEISKEIIKITKTKNLKDATNKFNSNNRLFIIIDNIQQVEELNELLEFLTTLRKTNPHNIVNFLGINHSFINEIKPIFDKNNSVVSAIYKIKPFNLDGVIRIININNKFYDWTIPLSLAKEILELSGGNPRLIKYISKVLMEEGFNNINNINLLINHPLLEPKINIFIDLLFKLNTNQLKNLYLLNEQNELFSNLIKYKLDSYELPYIKDLMPELTKKEQKIFSYLLVNKNHIVPIEKIDFINNLVGDSYSMWASYKAIERLKNKIKNKFILKNIKGQGYLLSEVR